MMWHEVIFAKPYTEGIRELMMLTPESSRGVEHTY